MKRLFILPVLLLSFLIAETVFSANFQNGADAYLRGDFATALKEFRPLAEQEDANDDENYVYAKPYIEFEISFLFGMVLLIVYFSERLELIDYTQVCQKGLRRPL